MMNKNRANLVASAVLFAALTFGGTVTAGELPKATQQILKDLKFSPDDKIFASMDEEASSTPAAIVDAANKEGLLNISGSFNEILFRKVLAPFKERFPKITVKYFSGDQNARNIKPLIAYRNGSVLVDIIEGLGVNLSDYKTAGALQKIGDLPNVKNIPADIHDPDGYWVAPRVRPWCLTYNTNTFTAADMPKTWDDLLTNTKFYNKHLGIVNRPNNFMIMLWGAKGPEWSKNFMEKLFTVVKPQLRQEDSDSAVGFVSAGEMDVSLPLADYKTYEYFKKGAPISWHCPEPVPLSFSAMVIMNKSPHSNAAKLYINWFLSKEGQLASYYADGSTPIHKDLQDTHFLPYPDQIVGKKMAPRYPSLLENDMEGVAKIWDANWKKASSAGR
jgi:ABC-type Fe3+ transport system substrate-binding protein